MFRALIAAAVATLGLATASAHPLNVLPPHPHRAALPASAAGAVAGVGVYNGWWMDASGNGALSSGVGSLGAAAAGGIIGAAGALVGYEAIVCRTMHADPLRICVRHSWRVY